MLFRFVSLARLLPALAWTLAACSGSSTPGGNVPPATGSGGASQTGSGGSVTGEDASTPAGTGGVTGTGGVMGTGGGGGSVVQPPQDASMPPADTGTTPPGGDDVPERPLNIDKTSPQMYTITFTPSQADPMASSHNDQQTAGVNTGAATIRGKLVVLLSGVGSPPGPTNLVGYTANLGFHAFAVAYNNSFDPSGQNNPALFGNMRQEEFDGMDHVPNITVTRPDCVEVRVAKALAYLQAKNPQGDWGYFLKSNGEVRWSDVIFMGHSHGASSAAYFAKIRRLWRAVSLSGPRDTNPVVATWLGTDFLTPKDRLYGFTGTGDAQHPDHIKAMQTANYPGALVDTGAMQPPYGNSHRLSYNGGHNDSTNCAGFNAVCRYMLGVQ